MRKHFFTVFTAGIAFFLLLTACRTVNYTQPIHGKFFYCTTANKGFTVIDIVSVVSTETHTISPLGIVRKVEGSKVGYTDLVQEAAKLEADDIIDIRIEKNTESKTGFFDWIKGQKRIFTYTGEALAIKYIDDEAEETEPDDEEHIDPETEELDN